METRLELNTGRPGPIRTLEVADDVVTWGEEPFVTLDAIEQVLFHTSESAGWMSGRFRFLMSTGEVRRLGPVYWWPDDTETEAGCHALADAMTARAHAIHHRPVPERTELEVREIRALARHDLTGLTFLVDEPDHTVVRVPMHTREIAAVVLLGTLLLMGSPLALSWGMGVAGLMAALGMTTWIGALSITRDVQFDLRPGWIEVHHRTVERLYWSALTGVSYASGRIRFVGPDGPVLDLAIPSRESSAFFPKTGHVDWLVREMHRRATRQTETASVVPDALKVLSRESDSAARGP